MSFPASAMLPKASTQASSFINENPPTYLVCPICADLITIPYMTSCGHVFCYHCLCKWLDVKLSCAFCRQEVTTYPILCITINQHIDSILTQSQRLERRPAIDAHNQLKNEQSKLFGQIASYLAKPQKHSCGCAGLVEEEVDEEAAAEDFYDDDDRHQQDASPEQNQAHHDFIRAAIAATRWPTMQSYSLSPLPAIDNNVGAQRYPTLDRNGLRVDAESSSDDNTTGAWSSDGYYGRQESAHSRIANNIPMNIYTDEDQSSEDFVHSSPLQQYCGCRHATHNTLYPLDDGSISDWSTDENRDPVDQDQWNAAAHERSWSGYYGTRVAGDEQEDDETGQFY